MPYAIRQLALEQPAVPGPLGLPDSRLGLRASGNAKLKRMATEALCSDSLYIGVALCESENAGTDRWHNPNPAIVR